MRLTIEHLAKIAHAELEFNGITIVAGENNTGKSTAGKVLYTIFSALSNLQDRVSDMRRQEIEGIVYRMSFVKDDFIYHDIRDDIVELCNGTITREVFYERLRHLSKESSTPEEELAECTASIETILSIPDHTIEERVIEQRFSTVFCGQYESLLETSRSSHIRLVVKKHAIDLLFSDKKLTYSSEIQLQNNAHMIDNPAILDVAVKIQRRIPYSYGKTEAQAGLLRSVAKGMVTSSENPDSGVINDILNREQLKTISDYMRTVVDGEMRKDKTETYKFFGGNLSAPVDAGNLSMGLKAFVLLQFLIQNRVLNPKDVLILDEPEIHLHPEWQLKYAELVVLLQKYFDLTILITSHSPYFIDAIRLYSKKHGISDKVNAYCSVLNADKTVTMNAVKPDDWDELFAHFVPPIDELHALRNEYMKEE